jgi:MFS family permease
MELDGMPLHPLVNDTAVALIPLAVLAALALALLPSWRWLARWAALLTSLVGLVAVVLTVWTGRDLLASRVETLPPGSPNLERLQLHEDRANLLLWSFVAFTIVVVVAFFLLPATSRLVDGRMGAEGSGAGWVPKVVPGLLVVLGVAVLVVAVLTGHAGAQAVWGG